MRERVSEQKELSRFQSESCYQDSQKKLRFTIAVLFGGGTMGQADDESGIAAPPSSGDGSEISNWIQSILRDLERKVNAGDAFSIKFAEQIGIDPMSRHLQVNIHYRFVGHGDSAHQGPEHFSKLYRAVLEAYRDGAESVVVVYGSGRMDECSTAVWLELRGSDPEVDKTPCPVTFCATSSFWDQVGGDAEADLIWAVLCAIALRRRRRRGVTVAIGDNLMFASRARKVFPGDRNAVDSPDSRRIARRVGGFPSFSEAALSLLPELPETAIAAPEPREHEVGFDVSGLLVVKLHGGVDVEPYRKLVEQGVVWGFIIVQKDGGNIGTEYSDGKRKPVHEFLEFCRERGVYIFICRDENFGRITTRGYMGLKVALDEGAIICGDANDGALRMLIAWLRVRRVPDKFLRTLSMDERIQRWREEVERHWIYVTRSAGDPGIAPS